MTLYEELIQNGVEVTGRYSDLHFPVNDLTRQIVRNRGVQCTTFKNEITGKMMYESFGAYDPYWLSVCNLVNSKFGG